MHIYTEKEFKKKLRKYGLKPTAYHPGGCRIWETKDGSHPVCIEEGLPGYPESMLDDVLREMGCLYHEPGEY